MTALDSLIRLHRWQLDEQRRAVNELEALTAKLRYDILRLDAEQASEQDVVRRSSEIAFGYGSYTAALIIRRQKLVESLNDAEDRTAKARDVLAETFQMAKRYEIAAAKRVLSQRLTQQKVEQTDMDELGIDIHRRSNRRQNRK